MKDQAEGGVGIIRKTRERFRELYELVAVADAELLVRSVAYIAYFDRIIMDLPHTSKKNLIHGYIYGSMRYIKSNAKAHIQ